MYLHLLYFVFTSLNLPTRSSFWRTCGFSWITLLKKKNKKKLSPFKRQWKLTKAHRACTLLRTGVIENTSSVEHHSPFISFPEQAFQGVLMKNDSSQKGQDKRSKNKVNFYPVLPRKALWVIWEIITHSLTGTHYQILAYSQKLVEVTPTSLVVL